MMALNRGCRAKPKDVMPRSQAFGARWFYVAMWARLFSGVFSDFLAKFKRKVESLIATLASQRNSDPQN